MSSLDDAQRNAAFRIGRLVKVIQQQRKVVVNLKQEVQQLRADTSALDARVTALET